MSTDGIRELIIIGSGPAGFTAAIYAGRAGFKPLIFAGPQPGGQPTTTTVMENFPGFPEGIPGPQLMQNMQKQAERFGAEIKFSAVTKVELASEPKKIFAGDETYQARAVIIATGSSYRTLGLPKEKELLARGLHTCATCDGFFYRGKTVAVIGGGDSAMEESNFLTKFADQVYLIHRRAEFRASEIMKQRTLANKKIKIILNSEVIEYLVENKLTGVKIKNILAGEITELKIDGLFFAIGHIPNTDIFKGQIALNEKEGHITTTNNVYTSIEGVLAAGDCADFTYRQSITAAALGAMAAMAARKWLEKN
ncbi:thioredoxin-disulfide reductase [Candidatus Falkowbacteria bacterium CG10_big_fil_rev_8_21_14_0_10_43_11]|uniref:Thioredoxin reductase n=1 Tax=Candidatus Falkowbacteria bacterium CG10_big_fil_rev_8_21_14_0_10_43_11 TaxID=1974568 RepID=A0A2M6WMX1_9BACT|nr:MAG: thioredoxin-disulfide reductase [Candidatus Falkowbacteria bacterium CG10_big_fil_rev_8_21_14_0_10_43_11]